MRLVLLCLLGVFTTSCFTSKGIERRCLESNLTIESLQIEDTYDGKAHAKVKCVKRKGF